MKQIELELGEVFEIKVGKHISTWKMITPFTPKHQSDIDWQRLESGVDQLCTNKNQENSCPH